MSHSPSSSSSPHRRDEWWGETDNDHEQGGVADTIRRGPNDRQDPNDPAEWIARTILRAGAEMLCSTTLFDDPYNGGRTAELCAWLFEDECIDGRGDVMHKENREVELSDPTFVRPKDGCEAVQHRFRARVNMETGYISFDESTGTIIKDRPSDEFLDRVDTYIEVVRQREEGEDRKSRGIREADYLEAQNLASRMKHSGDHRDIDIMTAVVRAIREGR